MTEAMQKARVEPVIVEELVRYGFDQGIEQGLRYAVLAVREARKLAPSAEERRRLEVEANADKLRRWIARAAVAGSVQEALD
jgi:ribosomal protein L13E